MILSRLLLNKNLLLFFTGLLLLFFQIHPLLPFCKIGCRPDFLLILVLFIGINYTILKGAFCCFLLGCFIDVFSGATTGLYSTIYLSIFIVIKFLQKFLVFDSAATLFFGFIVGVFFKSVIMFTSFYLVFEYNLFSLRNYFLMETIYTFLLFPFLFFLMTGIFSYKNINSPLKKAPNNVFKS
jgi:rod shape-determining protein MreD